ncbi:MAG: hypothetical protein FVQ82_09240 [Planctomycetes bacterium]|nr:hypothetical protein [Planctomycetota bacterium]
MSGLISRRKFMRTAAGFGVAAVCASSGLSYAESGDEPKVIIVLFGGGTRSSETIDDPSHQYIPKLWNKMMPAGTLFTNMRVEGKVVHPNSAGSVVTGHWEWDDIDWTRPVKNPTIYEIYRKANKAADTSAWAFVYASILTKTGYSLDKGYGEKFGANVVVPPTISRAAHDQMKGLMQAAAASGSTEAEIAAARKCERIAKEKSRIDFSHLKSETARGFMQRQYDGWKNSGSSTSHDAFLADSAIECMKKFAPAVISVDFGEIDCAHYGSWSRYVDAIARTDELTWKIWRAVQEQKEYRGNTLMLILPDHGREADRPDDPGHFGFIHHSDFYTGKGVDESCRRVWMLAIGEGVKKRKIEKAVPITAVAATALEHLGLSASPKARKSVLSFAKGEKRKTEKAFRSIQML